MHPRHPYRYILMAGLLIVGGAAFAQGLGIGSGVDDLRLVGKAVALTPCTTNFVFDWTDATGCQAITAVIR